jgi:hypothetical protein
MDWLGDPLGAAAAAGLCLAILFLVAVSFGRARREKQSGHVFSSSEPETTQEYTLHPEDVHRDDEPPSAL